MQTCPTCGNRFEGNFCSECGNPAPSSFRNNAIPPSEPLKTKKTPAKEDALRTGEFPKWMITVLIAGAVFYAAIVCAILKPDKTSFHEFPKIPSLPSLSSQAAPDSKWPKPTL